MKKKAIVILIGSIGKSITAFMTLILVNDGLIDLNATINQYIPEYSGPGKNNATIHLRKHPENQKFSQEYENAMKIIREKN